MRVRSCLSYLLGFACDSFSQGSARWKMSAVLILRGFCAGQLEAQKEFDTELWVALGMFTPLTDVSGHVQSFRPGQTSATYPCTDDITAREKLPHRSGRTRRSGSSRGLTTTYYKTFAPRIGIAWSPGDSGKTSIRAGWGMFYNPMEQLVLEQFSAEPPFGGSNIINAPLFNTPYQSQDGSAPKPNPFNGIIDPPKGQDPDWQRYRPLLLYGQFQPHLRTQYSVQYNLNFQRELAKDLVFQIGYVGSQGHRLLASHDVNFGNAGSELTCGDCRYYPTLLLMMSSLRLHLWPVLFGQLVFFTGEQYSQWIFCTHALWVGRQCRTGESRHHTGRVEEIFFAAMRTHHWSRLPK